MVVPAGAARALPGAGPLFQVIQGQRIPDAERGMPVGLSRRFFPPGESASLRSPYVIANEWSPQGRIDVPGGLHA